jgi:signal transduction histidine kinase/CHASE3 domain sensor protein
MDGTKRARLALHLSLIVSFLILTIMTVITIDQFRAIPSGHLRVLESLKTQNTLQQLFTVLVETESRQRAYLITQEEDHLQQYHEKKASIQPLLQSLDTAIIPGSPQRMLLESLDSLVRLRVSRLDSILLMSEPQDELTALKKGIRENERIVAEIRVLTEQLRKMETAEVNLQASSTQRKTAIHPMYLLAEMCFSLAIFTVAYIILNRNLVKQRRANQQLSISNTIYKQVEKISDSGHWHFSLRDKKIHFSTNMYRLLGYEPQSFQPDMNTIIKTIHKDDRIIFIRALRLLRTSSETPAVEFRALQKDGFIRTFRMIACQTTDGDNQKIVIGANLDLTEEIESNKRLQRLYRDQKIQNNIFKNSEALAATGSYSYHHSLGKTEFSDNLFRILGFEPNSSVPSADKIMRAIQLPKKGSAYSDQDLLELISKYGKAPIKIVTPEGKTVFLTSKEKLSSETGEDISIISFKDVSAEIRVRRKLKRKNAELIKSVDELDSFNHIASHDLQEPLRKIQLFASQLLADGIAGREPKEADVLLRIRNAANRMQTLINDLLSLTRITKWDKVFKRVSLTELLEACIRDLKSDLEQKRAVLSYHILPEAEVIPFQIEQLFCNLISNALKYSRSGVPLHLEIKEEAITEEEKTKFRIAQAQDYVKIVFCDNGIGFEQIYAETIFAPFKRLHSQSQYSGTGIGLSICRKVVESHKGFIYAESRSEGGATFTILLPKKKNR